MRLHEDKKLFGRAVSNTASYFKVELYESVTYDRAVMGIEELIHSGLLG